MTGTRQTTGIPAGGQFAPAPHAELSIALTLGGTDGRTLGEEGATNGSLHTPAGNQYRPPSYAVVESILNGRGIPNHPSLSDVTRRVHSNRRQIAQAVKEMDETLLTAAVLHVHKVLPGAKELRIRPYRIWDQMILTFVRTADDEFIGANCIEGPNADWARRRTEGEDPGSVIEALGSITPDSDIWDSDPRCDFDPRSEEHIIYLDGRRRKEP